MWFLICGMAQFLFSSPAVNFKFLDTHFLLLPLDLICLQVLILTGSVLVWCPVTGNISTKEAHHVRSFCAYRRKQTRLLKRHVFKNQSVSKVQKKEIVSLYCHPVPTTGLLGKR